MSLIDETMVDVVLMDRVTASDGEGGVTTKYKEGAKFKASLTAETEGMSKVARIIAEQVEYRVVTKRNVVLNHHDVIKRVSDGQTFRIYYKNEDKQPPKSSSLNMRVTFAEIWDIPND